MAGRHVVDLNSSTDDESTSSSSCDDSDDDDEGGFFNVSGKDSKGKEKKGKKRKRSDDDEDDSEKSKRKKARKAAKKAAAAADAKSTGAGPAGEKKSTNDEDSDSDAQMTAAGAGAGSGSGQKETKKRSAPVVRSDGDNSIESDAADWVHDSQRVKKRRVGKPKIDPKTKKPIPQEFKIANYNGMGDGASAPSNNELFEPMLIHKLLLEEINSQNSGRMSHLRFKALAIPLEEVHALEIGTDGSPLPPETERKTLKQADLLLPPMLHVEKVSVPDLLKPENHIRWVMALWRQTIISYKAWLGAREGIALLKNGPAGGTYHVKTRNGRKADVEQLISDTVRIGLACPLTPYEALLLLFFPPRPRFHKFFKGDLPSVEDPLNDADVHDLFEDVLKHMHHGGLVGDKKGPYWLFKTLFTQLAADLTKTKDDAAIQLQKDVIDILGELVASVKTDVMPQYVRMLQSASTEDNDAFLILVVRAIQTAHTNVAARLAASIKRQLPTAEWYVPRFAQMAQTDIEGKGGAVEVALHAVGKHLEFGSSAKVDKSSEDKLFDDQLAMVDTDIGQFLKDLTRVPLARQQQCLIRPCDLAADNAVLPNYLAVTIGFVIDKDADVRIGERESTAETRRNRRLQSRLNLLDEKIKGPLTLNGWSRCTTEHWIRAMLSHEMASVSAFATLTSNRADPDPRITLQFHLNHGNIAVLRDPLLVARCYLALAHYTSSGQIEASVQVALKTLYPIAELAKLYELVDPASARQVTRAAYDRQQVLLDWRVAQLIEAHLETADSVVRLERDRVKSTVIRQALGDLIVDDDKKDVTLTQSELVSVTNLIFQMIRRRDSNDGVVSAGSIFASYLRANVHSAGVAHVIKAAAEGVAIAIANESMQRVQRKRLIRHAKDEYDLKRAAKLNAPVVRTKNNVINEIAEIHAQILSPDTDYDYFDDDKKTEVGQVLPMDVQVGSDLGIKFQQYIDFFLSVIKRTTEDNIATADLTLRKERDTSNQLGCPYRLPTSVPIIFQQCHDERASYFRALVDGSVRCYNGRISPATGAAWARRFSSWMPMDQEIYGNVCNVLALTEKFSQSSVEDALKWDTQCVTTMLLTIRPVKTPLPLRISRGTQRLVWDDEIDLPIPLHAVIAADPKTEMERIWNDDLPADHPVKAELEFDKQFRANLLGIYTRSKTNEPYLEAARVRDKLVTLLVDYRALHKQLLAEKKKDKADEVVKLKIKPTEKAIAAAGETMAKNSRFPGQKEEAARNLKFNRIRTSLEVKGGPLAKLRAVTDAYCVRQLYLTNIAIAARRAYHRSRCIAKRCGVLSDDVRPVEEKYEPADDVDVKALQGGVLKVTDKIEIDPEFRPAISGKKADIDTTFEGDVLNDVADNLRAVIGWDEKKNGGDDAFFRKACQHLLRFTREHGAAFVDQHLQDARQKQLAGYVFEKIIQQQELISHEIDDALATTRPELGKGGIAPTDKAGFLAALKASPLAREEDFAVAVELDEDEEAELKKKLVAGASFEKMRVAARTEKAKAVFKAAQAYHADELDRLLMAVDGFMQDENEDLVPGGQIFRVALWKLDRFKRRNVVNVINNALKSINDGVLLLGQLADGATPALTVTTKRGSADYLRVIVKENRYASFISDQICRILVTEGLVEAFTEDENSVSLRTSSADKPLDETALFDGFVNHKGSFVSVSKDGKVVEDLREKYASIPGVKPDWYLEQKTPMVPVCKGDNAMKLILPKSWDPQGDQGAFIKTFIPSAADWEDEAAKKRLLKLLNTRIQDGETEETRKLWTRFVRENMLVFDSKLKFSTDQALAVKKLQAFREDLTKKLDLLVPILKKGGENPLDEKAFKKYIDLVLQGATEYYIVSSNRSKWSVGNAKDGMLEAAQDYLKQIDASYCWVSIKAQAKEIANVLPDSLLLGEVPMTFFETELKDLEDKRNRLEAKQKPTAEDQKKIDDFQQQINELQKQHDAEKKQGKSEDLIERETFIDEEWKTRAAFEGHGDAFTPILNMVDRAFADAGKTIHTEAKFRNVISAVVEAFIAIKQLPDESSAMKTQLRAKVFAGRRAILGDTMGNFDAVVNSAKLRDANKALGAAKRELGIEELTAARDAIDEDKDSAGWKKANDKLQGRLERQEFKDAHRAAANVKNDEVDKLAKMLWARYKRNSKNGLAPMAEEDKEELEPEEEAEEASDEDGEGDAQDDEGADEDGDSGMGLGGTPLPVRGAGAAPAGPIAMDEEEDDADSNAGDGLGLPFKKKAPTKGRMSI